MSGHRELSKRAKGALEELGVSTPEELSKLSEAYALRPKGAGRGTLGELRAWLIHHDLDFALSGRGYSGVPNGFSDKVDAIIDAWRNDVDRNLRSASDKRRAKKLEKLTEQRSGLTARLAEVDRKIAALKQ